MEGLQRAIYENLMEIASKVSEGAYGTDNDIDTDAIEDDLYELIDAVL